MNRDNLIEKMPLFWKINIFISALLLFVVGLVEFFLEPLTKRALIHLYGGFLAWHEVVLWIISIVFPSLASSYVLSKILTKKLGQMAKVASSIANGNLSARFYVLDNKQDAFDVMAQSFNVMAEEIEKQITNERRLLADISHELRSPLTRMSIAAELLSRKHVEKGQEKNIKRLHKEIAHMDNLVSLLLSQSKKKLVSHKIKEKVNVTEVVTEVAEDFLFQGKLQSKNIHLNAKEDLVLLANPILLRRMFSNILSNALFYTPSGSAIEIEVYTSNDKAIITIRDYGPGVPDKELVDIFRTFYRVDNSRNRTSGGAGLGLALVKEVATALNGSVKAENMSPGLLITTVLPLE